MRRNGDRRPYLGRQLRAAWAVRCPPTRRGRRRRAPTTASRSGCARRTRSSRREPSATPHWASVFPGPRSGYSGEAILHPAHCLPGRATHTSVGSSRSRGVSWGTARLTSPPGPRDRDLHRVATFSSLSSSVRGRYYRCARRNGPPQPGGLGLQAPGAGGCPPPPADDGGPALERPRAPLPALRARLIPQAPASLTSWARSGGGCSSESSSPGRSPGSRQVVATSAAAAAPAFTSPSTKTANPYAARATNAAATVPSKGIGERHGDAGRPCRDGHRSGALPWHPRPLYRASARVALPRCRWPAESRGMPQLRVGTFLAPRFRDLYREAVAGALGDEGYSGGRTRRSRTWSREGCTPPSSVVFPTSS